ncbi:hypothetical protein EE612_004803 [Oryza sativa]|nr:hypothetical protein EE612_004803 [Oryza sativa]
MASPIPSPPPEPATDGDDAQSHPPPPTPHPATDPPPISPQNPTPPPPPLPASAAASTTPSPNHSGDPSRPIPSQAPAPPPPPTADPSPPLPHDNRTPQPRAAPPPAPAPDQPAPPSPPPSLPPSPPAPGSPESMLEREASEADGEPENMTLALALAETETEKAMPPTPPKAAEAAESPTGSPQKESALTIAKLLSGEDHAGTETKPVPEKAAPAATTTTAAVASVGGGGGGGGGGVGSKRWLLGGVPEKVRRSELRRAELGFRVLAAVFCLVSLSVMAADTTPGWSGDSFRRYNEYRYTLSASVLAFTYSGFQLVVEVHYFVTGRRIIRDPSGKYFNLAMDQILAYLLLSASSAALSRNDVWVSRFGVDQFAKLINASASMAFLAFVALGFSSIISAYHVFSSVF